MHAHVLKRYMLSRGCPLTLPYRLILNLYFQNTTSADLLSSVRKMAMPGGLKPAEPATPEVQQIADQVRADLEAKSGKKYPEYQAVSYSTQVVAGINYFIKVKVGADDYVHLRVYRDLSQQVSLSSYQENKTKDDDITYF